MKPFYAIPICIFFQITLFAQTDSSTAAGIQFIHENYKEALAKAKAEDKIIFVDCFTTWCGPCKMMSKLVFTDSSVAEFYNKNFVNLKLDMEAGEGPSVQQKNGITAFPTLLFLNSAGESVHKAVGFQDVERFLDLGSQAMKADEGLSAWTKRYDTGERQSNFLKEYALKLQEALDLRRQSIAVQYFKTQPDIWCNPDNLDFIYRFAESATDTFFYTLAHNRKVFENRLPPADIQLKIKNLVDERLYNNQNLPELTEADTLIALSQPKDVNRTSKFYRLIYYRMKGDRGNYALSAIKYFNIYKDNADELALAAITFNEQIEDKKQLNEALKWAKRAVKLDRTVSNQMILVHLYQKIGKERKAKSAAKDAIDIGKKTSTDFSEAESILKKD